MIELYSCQREIDGKFYSVEFYAKSFGDAKEVMKALKGRKLGKIIEQQPVCNECFQPMTCLECEDTKDGYYVPPMIPYYQN